MHTKSSYKHIICLLLAKACHPPLVEHCNISVQSTWPFQLRRGKVKRIGGKTKEKEELTSVWFSRGWSSFKTGNALRDRNPNWNLRGFSEREYFIENAMGCSLSRMSSCRMSNNLFQRSPKLSSELLYSLWRDMRVLPIPPPPGHTDCSSSHFILMELPSLFLVFFRWNVSWLIMLNYPAQYFPSVQVIQWLETLSSSWSPPIMLEI